jgi:thiamine-phosphate pyrophosphorylase
VKRKRLFDLSDVRLYCLTTAPRPGMTYFDMVSKACAGGADAIQLRDKTLSARELLRVAKTLQSVCDQHGALFILNDRVDVALAADVDGIHIGQEDLPVRVVRQMVGHKKLIGCSTHSTAQALQAAGDGADYVSCGPLFPTPTKPDYVPVGLDLVKEYRALLRIPFGGDTVAEGIVIPEEMRGKIPTDYGRSRGVAWYYLGGFGLVHTAFAQARIVKWDST